MSDFRKHFVWNPDAPSFVPRNLTNYRNTEPQNHRPTLHSVRTPPAAPLPLMSTHIAAPGQIQGLALANPQALSVQVNIYVSNYYIIVQNKIRMTVNEFHYWLAVSI